MKLIPMTDFVLEAWKTTTDITEACEHNTKQLRNIIEYARFLKQPLKLEMFVPCDEEGNVLDTPTGWGCGHDPNNPMPDEYMEEYSIYREAKEKVLFENVKVKEFGRIVIGTDFTEITIANTKIGTMPNWTIEDLVRDDVYLTPSAIKQIGL